MWMYYLCLSSRISGFFHKILKQGFNIVIFSAHLLLFLLFVIRNHTKYRDIQISLQVILCL